MWLWWANQFNSLTYDEEFRGCLSAELAAVVAFVTPGGGGAGRYRREVQLVTDFAYILAGTLSGQNFPGCDLENLAFPKLRRWKAVLLAVAVSLPEFVFQKLMDRATPKQRDRLARLRRVFSLVQTLLFVNFIAKNGPIDIIHWLFGIKYSVVDPSRRRFLDNEYLNKTVVWNHFVRVFLLLLPFLRRTIFPAVAQRLYLFSSYIGPFMGGSNFDESEFTKCAVCGDSRPTNSRKNE